MVPPRSGRIGVRCVFSRETVAPGRPVDGSRYCHGYGSSVTVTATFGMVAANEAITAITQRGRKVGPTASL